jgi:hypothetical protein
MESTTIPRWLRAFPNIAKKAVVARVPVPEAQGGEMWQRMYHAALVSGHPQPEKMADTMIRSREKALELAASRHKIIVTNHKPKTNEIAAPPATKKARAKAVLHEALRCKAKTLEGRQCGFKATCGLFCSKHKV